MIRIFTSRIIALPLFLLLFCLTALVVAKNVSAAGANLSFSFDNNGDSSGNFAYQIYNKFNSIIVDDVVSFSGYERYIDHGRSFFEISDNGPYRLVWEPIKPYAADPRDVNCQDPETTFSDTGITAGDGTKVYVVVGSFACWIPSGPPRPGGFDLTNEITSCGSGTTAQVTFEWGNANGADYYDLYYGTGGSTSLQLSNVTSPRAVTGFTAGTAITWRIRAMNAGGGTFSNQTWTVTTASPCPPVGPTPTPTPTPTPGLFSLGVQRAGTGSSSGLITAPGGTINCGSDCSENFSSGLNVVITASVPSGGATFDGWSGGTCGGSTSTNCTVPMTQNQFEIAIFTIIGGGSLSCSGPTTGSTNTNYTFVASGGSGAYSWTSGGTPGSGSSSTYTTQWSTAGSKNVWIDRGVDTASCQITISSGPTPPPPTPPPGSYSLTIVKNGTGTGTARFYDGGGVVDGNPPMDCGSTCTSNYTDGSQTQIRGIPSSGSTFSGWSGCNSTFGQMCMVTLSSNKTITVWFDSIQPPTNLTVSGLPACASGAYTMQFNWTNSAQSGWAIDVDNDNNFTNGWLATKNISSGTSTPGPAGFNNNLTLQPGVNYDWRIYYTVPNTWAVGPDFSVPWCKPSALSVTTPPCAGASYVPTFDWAGAAGANWWINIDTNNNWNNTEASKQLTAASVSTTGAGLLTFIPGTVYRWNIWYGEGTGVNAHFIVPPSTEVIGNPPASSPYVDNRPYLFAVPSCAPSGLTVDVLPACAPASGYSATLGWTGSGAGWFVDLTTSGTFASFSNKAVPNVTQTTAPTGFSPSLTLLPDVNYYWRIYYGVANTWMYYNATGGSTVQASATPVNVPECVDLVLDNASSSLNFYTDSSYSTVKFPAIYEGGETVYARVLTTNSGPGNITTPFVVGFYKDNSAPTCATVRDDQKTINSLAVGVTDTWDLSFAAPSLVGAYVASAFADATCEIAESNETNNLDTRGYSVDINGWFQTTGADVGAEGTITSGKRPPNCPATPICNSDYMILANTADNNIVSQKWKFTGANLGSLMSAPPYAYLAGRLLTKAQATASSCNPANVTTGLAYCSAGLSLGATNIPAGRNVAWFVNGNLRITGPITVDPTSTLAVMVSGDISVDTSVTNLQGIYIAGGDFEDTDASGATGAQLIVNGAVYAGGVILSRVLGGPSCGVICDNVLNPAEIFNFDPKYLLGLTNIMGTAAVSWQEVAP